MRQKYLWTDRGKTVYPPLLRWSGGITTLILKVSTYWTRCDTSDNVCLNLQNCHYSIQIPLPLESASLFFKMSKATMISGLKGNLKYKRVMQILCDIIEYIIQ